MGKQAKAQKAFGRDSEKVCPKATGPACFSSPPNHREFIDCALIKDVSGAKMRSLQGLSPPEGHEFSECVERMRWPALVRRTATRAESDSRGARR